MCELQKMYDKILQRNGKLTISPECVGYKSGKISNENTSFKKGVFLYNPYSKKVRNHGKKS